MARDYARKSPPPKSGPPGWVWAASGLVVGLFVAFLVYLDNQPEPSRSAARTPAVKEKEARGVRQETAKTPEKKDSGLQFDFYSILPEFEIAIPQDRAESDPEAPPTPVTDPGRYVLQAGSFRNARDADARKAQLALLGIISSIQMVTIDNRQTWHRVRVGPYDDLDQLNDVRVLLRENDIEFMLLREKG